MEKAGKGLTLAAFLVVLEGCIDPASQESLENRLQRLKDEWKMLQDHPKWKNKDYDPEMMENTQKRYEKAIKQLEEEIEAKKGK